MCNWQPSDVYFTEFAKEVIQVHKSMIEEYKKRWYVRFFRKFGLFK